MTQRPHPPIYFARAMVTALQGQVGGKATIYYDIVRTNLYVLYLI